MTVQLQMPPWHAEFKEELKEELTEQHWLNLGQRFGRELVGLNYSRSQHMWAVGDWLVQGEDMVFKNRTRAAVRQRAAGLTGYAPRTMAMAASVARRVEPSSRVEGLSWWHHLVVASLERQHHAVWLTRAAENMWTAARLRQELVSAGLTSRRRARPATTRLVTELLKLRRDDLPGEMVGQLAGWWAREFGEGRRPPPL
jgi:hypothetical protein